MSWTAFGTLLLLNFVGSLSPGPDTFFLLRLATRSRIHAFTGVLGIATGLLLWVTLTVVGAAALLSTYPSILSLIQIIGGGYLVYNGFNLTRSAVKELIDARAHAFRESTRPIPDASETLGSPAHTYRQGLATNLSNPKVVMYFAAILAPLMPTNPSPALAVGIILAIIVQTIIVFGSLTFIVSTEKVRKAVLRLGPVFDLSAGIVFLVVGGTLFFEGAGSLL